AAGPHGGAGGAGSGGRPAGRRRHLGRRHVGGRLYRRGGFPRGAPHHRGGRPGSGPGRRYRDGGGRVAPVRNPLGTPRPRPPGPGYVATVGQPLPGVLRPHGGHLLKERTTMFTGIVLEMGEVRGRQVGPEGAVFTITAPQSLPRLRIGESIAVNGVCLTVTSLSPGDAAFTVQAVP